MKINIKKRISINICLTLLSVAVYMGYLLIRFVCSGIQSVFGL